jgi:lysophospholipase L1-like esterase
MRLHLALSALLGMALVAHAQEKKPAPATPKPAAAKRAPAKPAPKGWGLKDGDRVIFIGDSITHQCLYTQYVEDYFFTRYPNVNIKFRNAGISGDRAQDALDRFDDDIAPFKPTVATVLLGMNDGSYRDFDPVIFKTYADGMTKLCDRLDALKCRVILMSPTMFDHQAFEQMVAKDPARSKNKDPQNYNGVLAYYGKWVQETARKRGYGFVDLYGPLNTLTTQGRRQDPNFTLIADAIHPGPDGQLIMAYELLKQTGELGGIFGSGVRLADGQWRAINPTLVTDVKGEPGKSVSYTATIKSLPWIVPAEAALGYKLSRAGHTGSQESHIVVGLDAGYYSLRINGQDVGRFDERMLGVHAEIEENPNSPTHQQALKVAELNKQRNAEAINPLRGLYGQRKGKLRAAKEAANQAATAAPSKDGQPAPAAAKVNSMEAFNAWRENELKPKEAELLKKAEAFEEQIRQVAQPQPVKVEIIPTAAPAKPMPKARAKPVAKKAA